LNQFLHSLLLGDTSQITMQRFLIIGASSGIGQELARQLAESGNTVFATFRHHQPSLVHPNVSFHHLDVLEEPLSLDFLPDELTGLAYCPGSINLRPFDRLKPADFEADFRLQVIGAIRLIQLVLPRLRKAANGSIVLFSTVAVQTGLPFHAQVAASKGALEGLAKALAAEFAPKIRVNCVAPSLTDTPLSATFLNTAQKAESNAQKHPLKRIGTAGDIANMAAFLLSGKAGWITGQVIPVDGGLSSLRC